VFLLHIYLDTIIVLIAIDMCACIRKKREESHLLNYTQNCFFFNTDEFLNWFLCFTQHSLIFFFNIYHSPFFDQFDQAPQLSTGQKYLDISK